MFTLGIYSVIADQLVEHLLGVLMHLPDVLRRHQRRVV